MKDIEERNNMEEWKKIKISDICNRITSGGTPKSTIAEYYGGNIPWLNTKEINFNRIFKTEKSITDLGLKSSSAKLITINSVVVAMYGATAGKVAITKIPLTTNQACCNLSIDSTKADYRYVYYALSNDYSRLASLANGGAQQNLNAQLIKDFEIIYPSLEKQKRIANILSSLDDKIELNNRINANLEEQAQALFHRWFVDFEFPNKEGLPYKSNGGAFVDSELGRIPKKWSVKTIADVAELTAGGDKPSVVANKPTGECSVPIFSNGISDEGLYGYTTNAKIFKESVTISARGTIGFVRLRQEPFLPIVRLITATPKTDFVSAKYLYLLLLDKNISGTGTTQQQLTVPDFGRYELIVPTLSVIKNFNKIANIIYDNITFLRHENENLESLRDTFLPKLMNNEIKL